MYSNLIVGWSIRPLRTPKYYGSVKKNEKKITNVAKEKVNKMSVQLDLEGRLTAWPPGSDFMCYLYDIQRKIVNVDLGLIKNKKKA